MKNVIALRKYLFALIKDAGLVVIPIELQKSLLIFFNFFLFDSQFNLYRLLTLRHSTICLGQLLCWCPLLPSRLFGYLTICYLQPMLHGVKLKVAYISDITFLHVYRPMLLSLECDVSRHVLMLISISSLRYVYYVYYFNN